MYEANGTPCGTSCGGTRNPAQDDERANVGVWFTSDPLRLGYARAPSIGNGPAGFVRNERMNERTNEQRTCEGNNGGRFLGNSFVIFRCSFVRLFIRSFLPYLPGRPSLRQLATWRIQWCLVLRWGKIQKRSSRRGDDDHAGPVPALPASAHRGQRVSGRHRALSRLSSRVHARNATARRVSEPAPRLASSSSQDAFFRSDLDRPHREHADDCAGAGARAGRCAGPQDATRFVGAVMADSRRLRRAGGRARRHPRHRLDARIPSPSRRRS